MCDGISATQVQVLDEGKGMNEVENLREREEECRHTEDLNGGRELVEWGKRCLEWHGGGIYAVVQNQGHDVRKG